MTKNVLIIAEAGVNHNGDMEIAKKLIDVAANAKVDFIKFQSFTAETLVTDDAEKAPYQQKNTGNNASQFEMLKKLELSKNDHEELIRYCQSKNIEFLSTPFAEANADYLENIVPFFKIPSGEITNIPFLEHIARKKKPIVISTGMSNMEEVLEAIKHIKDIWLEVSFDGNKMYPLKNSLIPALTILHCTTAYPTPFAHVNLKAMNYIAKVTELPIGYSDHTSGIEVSIAAVALGATIIEKHFTLDRKMEGPDHAASLEPDELINLVQSIRNISEALGIEKKELTSIEKENLKAARKSIYYKQNFPSGHILSLGDIVIKRPGLGLHPKYYKKIINKKLIHNVNRNQSASLIDIGETILK